MNVVCRAALRADARQMGGELMGRAHKIKAPTATPVGMSMKWCWYVVKTDNAITPNQTSQTARRIFGNLL